MKVQVGISNRHVHLSYEDYKLLFNDLEMPIRNNLKQPNQFASTLTVTISTPKGEIPNVRILGPVRSYTQVEISKTDAYKLGIDPPIRNSGDLKGAVPITIISPFNKIERNACIIATRHIHVDAKIRQEKKLEGVYEVSLKVPGLKSGILNHVYLKDTTNAYFEVHLDTDDANAFLLKNEMEVEIIQ